MADSYLNFGTGPYFKPFMDNSFNSFVQHSDDRGIQFKPVEEGSVNKTANAKEELVTGISQTTPGNVASTVESVTGILKKSSKPKKSSTQLVL